MLGCKTPKTDGVCSSESLTRRAQAWYKKLVKLALCICCSEAAVPENDTVDLSLETFQSGSGKSSGKPQTTNHSFHSRQNIVEANPRVFCNSFHQQRVKTRYIKFIGCSAGRISALHCTRRHAASIRKGWFIDFIGGPREILWFEGGQWTKQENGLRTSFPM